MHLPPARTPGWSAAPRAASHAVLLPLVAGAVLANVAAAAGPSCGFELALPVAGNKPTTCSGGGTLFGATGGGLIIKPGTAFVITDPADRSCQADAACEFRSLTVGTGGSPFAEAGTHGCALDDRACEPAGECAAPADITTTVPITDPPQAASDTEEGGTAFKERLTTCFGEQDPPDCTDESFSFECGTTTLGINISVHCPILCDTCTEERPNGDGGDGGDGDGGSGPTGAIVGGVLGFLAVAAIVVVLVTKRQRSASAQPPPPSKPPPPGVGLGTTTHIVNPAFSTPAEGDGFASHTYEAPVTGAQSAPAPQGGPADPPHTYADMTYGDTGAYEMPTTSGVQRPAGGLEDDGTYEMPTTSGVQPMPHEGARQFYDEASPSTTYDMASQGAPPPAQQQFYDEASPSTTYDMASSGDADELDL